MRVSHGKETINITNPVVYVKMDAQEAGDLLMEIKRCKADVYNEEVAHFIKQLEKVIKEIDNES
jgi:hypothetical protein